MSMWQTSRTQYLLNQVALSNSIRRFWVNNNQWIRALIYSIVYGIADRQAIEERLRQNADELATVFSQFYGQEIGNRIRDNYLRYVQSLTRMIEAYRDNDITVIADQREVLYQIADELSQLLAQINRYWDQATLQKLLYELVNFAENQIIRIFSGDFAQSIREYNEFMERAYRVSDELTYGLLRQFQV